MFVSFADLSKIIEEICSTDQEMKRVKEQILAAEEEYDRKETEDARKKSLEERLQILYSRECNIYDSALRLQEESKCFELEFSFTNKLIDTNKHHGTMLESKISMFEIEVDNKETEKGRRSVLEARLRKLYVVRNYIAKLDALLQLVKARGRLLSAHFEGLYGSNNRLRRHAQPEKGYVEAMAFRIK